MNVRKFTSEYFEGLGRVLARIESAEVEKMVKMIWEVGKKKGNIFFIGNGGSASTATHMAADIGKNTVSGKKGEWRFRTWALTDNVAWLTAVGNDLAYEDVFVEQLKNLARKGDLLVAISGSGNSPNVVKSIKWASENGLKTIGMLGFKGGKAKKMVDLALMVPVEHYGYVEGVHSEIQHCVIEALKVLVGERK